MADGPQDEQVPGEGEPETEAPAAPLEFDEDEQAAEDAPTERDEPTEDEPAAEVPQGPQPPQTEVEAEKRQKAWDKERDKHMAALERGDDYRYALSAVCPICEGHGLMYAPQTPEEGAAFRGALLAIIGETTPEELHPHPSYHRCDTCDGYGKVRTGSRVPNQEALNCPECNGQGHSGGKTQAPPAPLPVPTLPTAAPPPADEQARIGNDAWGRAPGHPHYGLLPALVQ